MTLGDRISFGLFGLLVTLLGFVACSSEHDSAQNAAAGGSLHGIAGTIAIAATSGANMVGESGGGHASSSSAGSGFEQVGGASNAGVGGTTSGGASSMGLSGAPEAGAPSAASGSAGLAGAGRGGAMGAGGSSAAFLQVSAIFGKNCGIAGCHADKQSPHFKADTMLYGTLTAGTVLAECDYHKLIEPGDPSTSALVQLMNRKCGSFTMPPSCNKTTCLSAADLKTLTDWVQAGAPP